MSASLLRSARCFGLWAGDRLAAFAGLIHRVHAKVDDIKGCSRLVTLPDWQGLGLAMVLIEKLGAAHRALDLRLRTYPAHPALIRSFDKSEHWQLIKKPGTFSTSSTSSTSSTIGELGGRPCAVFEFCGPAMDRRQAERLIAA